MFYLAHFCHGIGELHNTVVEEPEEYLAPETEVETAWAR